MKENVPFPKEADGGTSSISTSTGSNYNTYTISSTSSVSVDKLQKLSALAERLLNFKN